MFEQFTLGIEEEFQIVDPANARVKFARFGNSGRRQTDSRRKAEARNDSVND